MAILTGWDGRWDMAIPTMVHIGTIIILSFTNNGIIILITVGAIHTCMAFGADMVDTGTDTVMDT